MTTIKTLIGTVALAAVSTCFAQTSNSCSWFPTGEDGPGVIGKRYADVGFGVQDNSHDSKNTYGVGIGANIPLIKGLDFDAGYSYDSYRHSPVKEHWNDISTGIKLYNTVENGVKPFISAGLGYSWLNEKLDDDWYFISTGKNSRSQGKATWGASVGAEFPFQWISVTPTISYHDDFERTANSDQAWAYGVHANSWITRKVGVSLGVSYVAWQHSSNQAWDYSTGVCVRF